MRKELPIIAYHLHVNDPTNLTSLYISQWKMGEIGELRPGQTLNKIPIALQNTWERQDYW
jgi:hypothetical protein